MPQGNVQPNAQPNVPQPAKPANIRLVQGNNPATPQSQVLPPTYQDYHLDNQLAVQPIPQAQVPSIQDNPPAYTPCTEGVPPRAENPYEDIEKSVKLVEMVII